MQIASSKNRKNWRTFDNKGAAIFPYKCMCLHVYSLLILHDFKLLTFILSSMNVFFCMFQWNFTMRTKRILGISFRIYTKYKWSVVLTTFLESKRLFWRVISWLNKICRNCNVGLLMKSIKADFWNSYSFLLRSCTIFSSSSGNFLMFWCVVVCLPGKKTFVRTRWRNVSFIEWQNNRSTRFLFSNQPSTLNTLKFFFKLLFLWQLEANGNHESTSMMGIYSNLTSERLKMFV